MSRVSRSGPVKLPFWRDHFVCPGDRTLELPPGNYTYEIERGPEYAGPAAPSRSRPGRPRRSPCSSSGSSNLAAEGWWSGDLHVHRPVEDIELLMRAEDLHVAPVITWWNNRNLWANARAPAREPLVRFDGNRFYHLMAGEDEREGGALLYFNLRGRWPITGASREYPSPMKFVAEARQAEGRLDRHREAVLVGRAGLAGERAGRFDRPGQQPHVPRPDVRNEAWGKPRDAERLPPPLGNGYWTQEIYYHMLNCGLRLPPSAGSASGVLPNPVGYNRVYVHTGADLDLRQVVGRSAGRPLLRHQRPAAPRPSRRQAARPRLRGAKPIDD